MVLLERRTPVDELEVLDRRMRRFFADLGLAPAFLPAVDAYETETEIVVEVEVPGFDEKEIGVEVRDHTLAVMGERKIEDETEKEQRLHERLERRFERRFTLPVDADAAHVTAEYDKGVLTVHVPRIPHEKPRKVAIKKA